MSVEVPPADPSEAGVLPDPSEAGGSQPDVLGDLIGFTAALRHAGVPVTTERVSAFLTALDELDLASEVQTYWAGRLTLCGDPDDVARYDLAFPAWFGPPQARTGRVFRPPWQEHRQIIASLSPAGVSAAAEQETEPEELTVAASPAEVLRHHDLGELTDAEREHLRALLALLRPDPPMRQARRSRPARRGESDPARTLRAALRTGGEVTGLKRRSRSRRPRRVVLLIDVSGSMSPYADALLRFAHVVARRSPAAVEVFTLGTRLTRITRELRQRDPERALAAASRAIPDWSGGTRLGEALRAFTDRWGQRGAARRAVVVVFSDGWERGDAALLGEQMIRLRRLTHRIMWVNPHAGKRGYAPVQGGIVAALPSLDKLLAGHSLATLSELLEVLRDA